jgi:hypothetical protein
MNTSRAVATCAAVLLASISLYASATDPITIKITSSWGGLGEPTSGELIIVGKGRNFVANGQTVNAEAVRSLLMALELPPVDQPTLSECGIKQEWLLANYKSALENYTHTKVKDLAPNGVELFKDKFTNPADAQSTFAELFGEWHTDDYPKMTVTVRSADREYGVESDSQHPFMLPWFGIDRRRGGYSCQISHAIATLLPKKFSNRERLVPGHEFLWRMTSQTMRAIKHEWDLFDTEFKVGPSVAPIFSHYTPVESAISNLSSIDLDGAEAWNAKLQSPDLPSNFIVNVSLNYREKSLPGVDALMREVPIYSRLVLSVPWLSDYIAAHPRSKVELHYVNGRSLSLKAERDLAQDLRQHGKDELASRVSNQAAQCAFLEIQTIPGTDTTTACWSRAVVFPNKELLIWHFQCDSVMLFSSGQFSTWDYYGWRSTGALVEPDGTLAK